MDRVLENWKKYTNSLNESSLNRLHQHIINHDCIIVSAQRKDPLDMKFCTNAKACSVAMSHPEKGPLPCILAKMSRDMKIIPLSRSEINENRHKELRAAILKNGYGVTDVVGSYIENFTNPQAVEVQEKSLFVANRSEDPSFFKKIADLAEIYCQDSILYIPKGGKGAFLYGTNSSSYPGHGNKENIGDLKLGEEHAFMTKTSKGKPFHFKEHKIHQTKLETYEELERLQKFSVSEIAKEIEKLLED